MSDGQYPSYPECKNSGIEWLGCIPAHWSVEPFKRQIERNDGGVWGSDPDGKNDTIVLRSTEQTVDGRWQLDDPAPRKLTKAEVAGALLAEGDLLLTKSSGSSLHIGKTTLVTPEVAALRCCYSNFMQRIRTKASFAPKLAWYVLNNELARRQLDLLSNSTTGLANLNATMVGQILVIRPPLAEQTQIAKFLDHETAKIDRLIEKQEALIRLLKEKRQAVISHAVTKGLNPSAALKDSGIEWLGQVPAHWVVMPLKRFISTRKGAPFKATDFTDTGIQVVRASDIKELGINCPTTYLPPEFLKSHPRAVLRAGELILSTVGSGPQVRNSAVGQIGRVPSELDGTLLNQNTVVFRVIGDQVSESLLFHLVRADGYRDHLDLHAHGTANQASLNVEDMLNFYVPIPPMDEQADISRFIDRIDVKMEKLEDAAVSQITLLQERRTALISAAVTGKIDVRHWQPPEN